jgi:uncharacterized protein (TIGR03000 family)
MPRLFAVAAAVFAIAVLGLAAAPAAAQEQTASLTVIVPTGATLKIGEWTSTQTGNVRRFETPLLAADRGYYYVIAVSWTENGQPKSASRQVEVRAGQSTTVDFTPQTTTNTNPNPNPNPNKIPLKAKSREFFFTYSGVVTDLKPGETARIWLPMPRNSLEQSVELVKQELPGKSTVSTEAKHGNRILYCEAKADDKGMIPFSVTYRVLRFEVLQDSFSHTVSQQEASQYLQGDKLVPVGGKGLMLLEGKKLPGDQLSKAKLLYDIVNDHMTYSKKGTGWGRGDSDWACDSKYGNCTDFHSLFLSLARHNKIPAKFEMGFSIPEKRGEGDIGGYHCWAFFKPEGRGWIPVDISEANKVKDTNTKMVDYYFGNLTEDRVCFMTGRDLTLAPKQDGPPLNIFIYPYVEVNGKTYDKVTRKFGYQDLTK